MLQNSIVGCAAGSVAAARRDLHRRDAFADYKWSPHIPPKDGGRAPWTE
jgi:hypothetical protein